MRPYTRLSLIGVLWLGACQALAAPVSAGIVDCSGIQVQISAGSVKDRALVCDGASKAAAFLQLHGFSSTGKIKVRLHDSAMGIPAAHIGVYDADARLIDILTYDQSVRQCAKQSPFGVPMDEELYVSFAAHEFAHAVTDQNFQVASRIAQEYIAYVTQISTMMPGKRRPILQRNEITAFKNAAEMSLIYYALAPSKFGVKAYRHYQSLSDPTRFLRALLSGEVRAGLMPEER